MNTKMKWRFMVAAPLLAGCPLVNNPNPLLTGTETGNGTEMGDGDGDGDGTPGDGDGDGDGTPGDGDGDGDGTPGDGDGDGTPGDMPNGDGDGDPICQAPLVAVLGDNAVLIPDDPSYFDGPCPGPGPEVVYEFTAPFDANYMFSLELSADATITATECDQGGIIDCNVGPIGIFMLTDQSVYIIIDSPGGPLADNLMINQG
jgi:hypothetical protein